MAEQNNNNESKNFSIEKKGYNKSEVDAHLRSLEESFKEFEDNIQDLEKELEETKHKLNEYQQIDSKIRDTLIYLRESERNTIDKTRQEVSEIIKEAEIKSKRIIEEAEEEAKSTRDTLLFLKEQHEVLLNRLKIIIDSQDAMLTDLVKGNDSANLQRSMAEAEAYKTQTEINIDTILEKLV